MRSKQHSQSWLLTALLFVATLMLPASVWAQSVATEQPAVGDGSEVNPYQIANAAQLAWFRDWVNGTYTPADGETATKHETACARLTADIDMSTVCSESIGSWEPISRQNLSIYWSGTFDGDGHTIANLYVNMSVDCAGMFGRPSDATIKNITFTQVCITGTSSYTGLIGLVSGGAVSGIIVNSGSITGDLDTGGIAGAANGNASISQCVNRASVTGSYRVGGICGYCYSNNSVQIELCANYGTVQGSSYGVGGIVGEQKNCHVSHCANYGNIEGLQDCGGITGYVGDACSITNVFTSGHVSQISSFNQSGLLVGYVGAPLTLSDYAVFSSDATLTSGETVQTPRGIGLIDTSNGGSVSGATSGYTTAVLQSGMVTYQLQIPAPVGTWGQQLGTDDYPQLGSAHTVYAEGDITVTCTGVISGGSFSDTRPDTEATVTFTHGTATHHDAVEKTCTADGSVEYWECDVCHRYFSDEALTAEITDLVVKCTGHSFDYATGSCTGCDVTIPSIGAGTHTIQIEAVSGEYDEINGYNLYRFVAPGDGELTVMTSGDEDTRGSLWSSDGTTRLAYKDDNEDDDDDCNFKFTYDVTKGTTYYIGVREYGGDAISGDYTLIISGTWSIDIEALTLTDGEEYTFAQNVTNFTYTRSFSHTNWQPLYVPFAMKSADWTAQGLEVACINNFHEYEEADGSTKVVLEVKKVTSGRLHPNTPYLIRALEAGEKTITLSNVSLANAESKTIDCASVTRLYTFTGIYSEKSSFDAVNDYTMTGGSLYHPEGALKPQRWYLTVASRGDIIDDEGAGAAPRQITVSVIGEGEVTGIEDIRIVSDNKADGRSGIYDLQGRRLTQEPAHGIYIKNGRKVVR